MKFYGSLAAIAEFGIGDGYGNGDDYDYGSGDGYGDYVKAGAEVIE